MTTPGQAQDNSQLGKLDIEALMQLDVVVTSAAKRQQNVGDAATAIFVITEQDIKTSGATHVPDLLRMVPGIHVARINTHTWAIGARGFNDRFANKLLVLIDGRSVYSALSSGVRWDERDVLIEDLKRIEVIRGPGGTLWGSNAVNGVINIITKNAKETQGGHLTAGIGDQEQYFGSGRYGGELGENAHYRFYVKGFSRDALESGSGYNPNVDWVQTQGGGRLDWQSDNDTITLQTDIYRGKNSRSFTVRTDDPTPGVIFSGEGTTSLAGYVENREFMGNISGGNVTARWNHTIDADSAFSLQFFYDRAYRNQKSYFKQHRDTYDIDFQHHFSPFSKHLVTWGGGFRRNDATTKGRPGEITYKPNSGTIQIWNAFVQEEFTVIDDVLTVSLGSRFEHHNFTGLEIQPSARFLWKPLPNHSIWGAVSRTTRTPARFERDGRLDILLANTGSPPVASSLRGNKAFDSEDLIAYELGYRTDLFNTVTVDIAGFYNVYNNLRSFVRKPAVLETGPGPAHVLIPFLAVNKAQARSYGVELAANWVVNDYWKLNLAYSYYNVDFSAPNKVILLDSLEANPPNHLLSLRSLFTIRPDLNLNLWLRYSDQLGSSGSIGSFITLDTRLAWQATKNLELSVVGQNLLEDTRTEGQLQFSNNPPSLELERSFFAKIALTF